jgi:hypothetical protein
MHWIGVLDRRVSTGISRKFEREQSTGNPKENKT